MENLTLKVIHTNDLHAAIEKLPKMAAYIETCRKQTDRLLYLDAGDIFSGDPVVDSKQGIPMVELLNRMDLDAMTIGNHDFDYGQTYFEINRNLSRFPWLAANVIVRDSEARIQQPQPYSIFQLEDLKVGVVSVTESPASTRFEHVKGIQFNDPVNTLRDYLWLRDDVDILIALTHVGIIMDRQIASRVEGYDLIIGGHSHTVVELETINGTPIINTGADGNFIGDLTVHYSRATHRICEIHSELIDVGILEDSSSEIQFQVDQYIEQSKPVLERKIASTAGLSIEHKDERDIPLGNFLADALCYVTGSDIALTNNGGLRMPIPAGDMTVRHVHKAIPLKNQVVVMELTGQALTDIIRYSYSRFDRIDLQTSGLSYTVLTGNVGEFLDVDLQIRGQQLDLLRRYRVATNDYLAFGGDGYDFCGTVLERTAGDVASAFIQFAEHCAKTIPCIEYTTEGRIAKKQEC